MDNSIHKNSPKKFGEFFVFPIMFCTDHAFLYNFLLRKYFSFSIHNFILWNVSLLSISLADDLLSYDYSYLRYR